MLRQMKAIAVDIKEELNNQDCKLQKINNGFSNHQLIFSWWFFIL